MITLRGYQQRVANHFARAPRARGVLCWHRRGGKDVAALTILYAAMCERPGLYLYFLPTASQGRKVIFEAMFQGRRLLHEIIPEGAIADVNATEMRIRLKNGAVLWILGSDNWDRTIGVSAYGLVYSEYALARPEGWDYLRPVLNESGGWALFLSTPRGRNHFHKMYEAARQDPAWLVDKRSIFDTQALPPTVIADEIRQGMPSQLAAQEFECSFDSSQVGSVYGELLAGLEAREGVADFTVPADASGVYTSWDIGMSDATSIIFWRAVEGEKVEVLEHYESSGKPLGHYLDHVKSRPYKYLAHWLPHDARQRSLGTGVSVLDLAREALGQVNPLGILPIASGLEAGRWLLQHPGLKIHKSKCAGLLSALRDYSYGWDAERHVFTGRPVHSWSSHSADAFRYMATVVRIALRRSRPEEKGEEVSTVGYAKMRLAELFEDHEKHKARRVRI